MSQVFDRSTLPAISEMQKLIVWWDSARQEEEIELTKDHPVALEQVEEESTVVIRNFRSAHDLTNLKHSY